ncbi:MAG: ribonuclease III [Patescibacteria group bacterium]
MDFSKLEKNLGYQFKNIDYLKEALTHRSYLNENSSWPHPHNERLEYLGDAVLELAATEYLFQNYQNGEGDLTAFRAALVNADSLAQAATNLEINDFLLLSKGEAKETGKARQEILGNTFEAVIGAIYLDSGFELAQDFIKRSLLFKLPEIIKLGLYKDAKSQFQEEAQARLGLTPSYQVLREWGPDHDKNFLVGAFLNSEKVAEAEGKSKQEAETKAAEKALEIKNWA